MPRVAALARSGCGVGRHLHPENGRASRYTLYGRAKKAQLS
jgi:hypothetical protein